MTIPNKPLALLFALVLGALAPPRPQARQAAPAPESRPDPSAKIITIGAAHQPPKPRAAQLIDARSRWCEPLDQPLCTLDADCPGSMRCVRPWWLGEHENFKVCALDYPSSEQRQLVREQLRDVVASLCTRSTGCDPGALYSYLVIMGMRESTLRPSKRHRLGPDLAAAIKAFERVLPLYADNPAVLQPDRWASGVGLYGQIPALLLHRWDELAPPETLCGVPEATLVHLRSARDRVRLLERGVTCDGETYHGSACTGSSCGASWYDVSRVNAGSNPCPTSESRAQFEHRVRGRLDLDQHVTTQMLGRDVLRVEQDAWADQLRASW